MPPCLRFALLAAVLFVPLTQAQDKSDDAQRQKIAAQEMEAKVKDRLAEAEQLSKKNPAGAIKEMEALASHLEVSTALAPARKQELKDAIASRIRVYRQALAQGPALEDRIRANQEKAREIQSKNEDMKQGHQQISEFLRQGKFREAGEIGEQWRKKYGNSPAAISLDRISRAGGALQEMQGIRDQRSEAFRKNWKVFMESMMPVSGDVTFPADWARRTKLRQEIKLTDKEKKLIKALETSLMDVSIKGLPVQAVLDDFAKRHDITINLEKGALDELGLTGESPVSITANRKSLRSVLKTMLGDVGLTFVIRNGELVVATPQQASKMLVTRTYYIGDLVEGTGFGLGTFAGPLQGAQSIAALVNMIQSIEPSTWQSGGGPGSIVFLPGQMTIIVKQSAEMQYMLQGTLGR